MPLFTYRIPDFDPGYPVSVLFTGGPEATLVLSDGSVDVAGPYPPPPWDYNRKLWGHPVTLKPNAILQEDLGNGMWRAQLFFNFAMAPTAPNDDPNHSWTAPVRVYQPGGSVDHTITLSLHKWELGGASCEINFAAASDEPDVG